MARGPLPVMPGPMPLPARGPVIRRDDDRRVAVASLVVAGLFLAAAAASILGPGVLGGSVAAWLPLHLALAGGAATAIAGMMPFFVAALGAAAPAGARLRASSVALVAVGAAGVAVRGVAAEAGWLPAAGGSVFLAGIALTGLAVRDAGRRGLMAKRPAVLAGYGLALGNVALGATIGTLFVAGWLPLVERWALLRPAHAWVNLVGFVSLVIASTLLHFLPTVLGTRIVPRNAGPGVVLGLGLGAPLVVAGFVLGSDLVVRAGALATLGGAAGLWIEAALDVRSRGRWTSDAGWHLVTGGMLVAGIAWFGLGTTLAAGRLLVSGAAPDAWSTTLVGAPLVAGWVVQVLIGSWTHLLPAIGRGGPVNHAARRVVLGRLAGSRLVALNAGTALLAVGWPAGIWPVAIAGIGLVAAVLGVSLWLAASALRIPEPGGRPER